MPQKKKKRKPRSRARGTAVAPASSTADDQSSQSQEKRRERLEARREAKAKAMVARRKQQQRARVVRIVVTLASIAAVVWFLFLRNSIPNAIAGHELEHFDTFATESRAGTLHTGDPITYDTDPPVSGLHRPTAANCGVYATQIPNENMVHTLEHGGVGILYQPTADVEEIKKVEDVVMSYDSHVFSEPYPELKDPYTVVAWAHLMRLDSYDQPAIEEFIDVFREAGDSPEDQECPMASNDPFDPTPTASPTATPEPTEAPGDKESDKSGDKKKKKKKD